jgi:hypothetical protein
VNVGGLLDIFSGGTGLGTVINSGGVSSPCPAVLPEPPRSAAGSWC